MIVESMTLKELRKEIEKDEGVHRKVQHHWESISKVMRKTRMSGFIKYYPYFSSNKNNWIYGIRGSDYGKKYNYYLMVYYYTAEGMTAVQVTAKGSLNLFSGHFFERYYERLSRDVNVPLEWMRSFMEDIRSFSDMKLEEVSPQYYKMMACIVKGACLGFYDAATNFYIYKTFLREDMLRGEQVPMFNKLKEHWDLKYKDSKGRYGS